MVLGHISDFSLKYEVGNSVFVDNKEWIIAEELNGKVKLQRDRIDGTSRTMDVTRNKLQKLVKESRHQFDD
ncbi:MAG: hypothetical protein CMF86_02910 [Candidatus Marinimicrobia bacterium]|nr:hypothetical protein [Candidatus Neomarinimicrobiota bacterium]